MSGPAPLPAGARVGSLRIDRVLGQGAFGVTYLATDTNSGKSCALKEYLPKALAHRGDGSQVAAVPGRQQAFDAGRVAFLEEAKTGRRLDHPNLVKVEDCFEANGTAYLRMPFLGGEPLHVLLQRGGTLDPEEARALTRPLLDALGYLHRQGIVHRDVKPANILVTPEPTAARAMPRRSNPAREQPRAPRPTCTRWRRHCTAASPAKSRHRPPNARPRGARADRTRSKPCRRACRHWPLANSRPLSTAHWRWTPAHGPARRPNGAAPWTKSRRARPPAGTRTNASGCRWSCWGFSSS